MHFIRLSDSSHVLRLIPAVVVTDYQDVSIGMRYGVIAVAA